MKVRALVRDYSSLTQEKKSYLDEIIPTENIDYLIQNSDFLITSLPLTEHTHKFMDREKFSKMKPSSIFINLGRGQTIDEESLISALKKKQIGGAVLDVYY